MINNPIKRPHWTVLPVVPTTDACLSCYLLANNSWMCTNDTNFYFDFDDSY